MVKSNPGSLDASHYTTDRALWDVSVSSSGIAAIGATALIPTEASAGGGGKDRGMGGHGHWGNGYWVADSAE